MTSHDKYAPPAEVLALSTLPPGDSFDGETELSFTEQFDVALSLRASLLERGMSAANIKKLDEIITEWAAAFFAYRAEPTDGRLAHLIDVMKWDVSPRTIGPLN